MPDQPNPKPDLDAAVKAFGFDSIEHIRQLASEARAEIDGRPTRAEIDQRLRLRRRAEHLEKQFPDDWLDRLQDAEPPQKWLKRHHRQEDISFVYFVQAESGGHVKIGTTLEWAFWRRMVGLQVGNPEPLVVRRLVYGSHREETWIHFLLRDLRYRGEWFRDEGKLAELLRVSGDVVSVTDAC